MIRISPGTISLAMIVCTYPLLSTLALSGCNCLRASNAASALVSYQTPIVAFAIRIKRITKGSTYAVIPSSSAPPEKARINETMAAAKRIRTRRSSNYAITLDSKLTPSSFGSSLGPYYS